MKQRGCFLRHPNSAKVCNLSLISRQLLTNKILRRIPKRFHFNITHYTIEMDSQSYLKGGKDAVSIHSPTSQMETANNWDDSSDFGGMEVETDQPGSPDIF